MLISLSLTHLRKDRKGMNIRMYCLIILHFVWYRSDYEKNGYVNSGQMVNYLHSSSVKLDQHLTRSADLSYPFILGALYSDSCDSHSLGHSLHLTAVTHLVWDSARFRPTLTHIVLSLSNTPKIGYTSSTQLSNSLQSYTLSLVVLTNILYISDILFGLVNSDLMLLFIMINRIYLYS